MFILVFINNDKEPILDNQLDTVTGPKLNAQTMTSSCFFLRFVLTPWNNYFQKRKVTERWQILTINYTPRAFEVSRLYM